MGPLWGTPLRNLILRALARKMRFRWEKTIWIWMETVVGGFKKSHFARIRAQNEISLEKNYMDKNGNDCGVGKYKKYIKYETRALNLANAQVQNPPRPAPRGIHTLCVYIYIYVSF